MKKGTILLGACLTSLLMISSVTALPQANSRPVMNTISEIEEHTSLVKQKEKALQSTDINPNGLIDLIKQLIQLIINFIQSLINIIRDLIGLVNLIEYLINLINVLITAFFELIQAILDLFSPSMITK